MLRCSNGAYYTGITTDINRRLKQHNSGRGSKYVAAHLPAVLVYIGWAGRDRGWAQKLERKTKKLTHKEKRELAKWYDKNFAAPVRKDILQTLKKMRQ